MNPAMSNRLHRITRSSSIDTSEEAWEYILNKFSVWEDNRPSDYAGTQWDGYVPFMFVNGTSHLIEHWNYKVTKEIIPNQNYIAIKNHPSIGEGKAIEEAKNRHWAAGYINYIMINVNAPSETVIAVAKILEVLDDYPILDEDNYHTYEDEAMEREWEYLSQDEREEFCKKKLKLDDADIHALKLEGFKYSDVINTDDSGVVRDYFFDSLRPAG